MRALQDTVEAAHARGVPVILDAKRGDIGNTSVAYAKAASSTFSEKRTRAVLKRYSGDLWRAGKLGLKNAWQYSPYPPPDRLKSCQTEL